MNAAVKKSMKTCIENQQNRCLFVSVNDDGKLIIKGDHISFLNLEEDEATKEALKKILVDIPEESDTSYNFGGLLTYAENDDISFPKMFAKMNSKQWKGGKIATTLSQYMGILGFGLNSMRTYGRDIDKPVWWPRKPKWKNFRNPSKASKEECTVIIKSLLEHYSIDPTIHYVDYPEDEDDSSSDSTESSDTADRAALVADAEMCDYQDQEGFEDDGQDQGDGEEVDVNLNNSMENYVDNVDDEFQQFEEEETTRRNYVMIKKPAAKRKRKE